MFAVAVSGRWKKIVVVTITETLGAKSGSYSNFKAVGNEMGVRFIESVNDDYYCFVNAIVIDCSVFYDGASRM